MGEADESFLAHQRMNGRADYVGRGRAHQGLPTHHLHGLWVDAFRRWMGEQSAWEMDDLAAELKLRGLDPPHERVRPELEVLQRRLEAVVDVDLRWGDGPFDDKINAVVKAREETRPELGSSRSEDSAGSGDERRPR